MQAGKDEFRAGAGPGPDLPGFVVDMVQVVVVAEEGVDAFHLRGGDRRRGQALRSVGGEVIHAQHGAAQLDEQAHLAEPPERGGTVRKSLITDRTQEIIHKSFLRKDVLVIDLFRIKPSGSQKVKS